MFYISNYWIFIKSHHLYWHLTKDTVKWTWHFLIHVVELLELRFRHHMILCVLWIKTIWLLHRHQDLAFLQEIFFFSNTKVHFLHNSSVITLILVLCLMQDCVLFMGLYRCAFQKTWEFCINYVCLSLFFSFSLICSIQSININPQRFVSTFFS